MSYVLSSLRSRLILLVMLCAIPLAGLLLYSVFEHRRLTIAEVQRNALNYANEIANSHAQIVDGARQLLIGLAQLPGVRDHDPQTCNRLFTAVRQRSLLYANLGAAKPNGDIFCSGLPLKAPVNLADRPYFQETLQTHDLAISGYLIGRISGRPSVVVAHPLVGASGDVRTVVYVGVDIAWLEQMITNMPLPPGSAVTLIDREGVILYRHPESEKWVGKPAGQPVAEPDKLLAGEGLVAEGIGMDGTPRLFAFSIVRGMPESRAPIVRVGIPSAWAFAEVNRISRRNLAIMALVILVALISAWAFSKQSLVRPIESLVNATNRLAGGDLGVRTGLSYRAGELGHLAESFDAMADALQTEEAQRNRAEEMLRESELRYRTLFKASPIGILVINPETMLPIDFNPTAHRQLGYSREEFAQLRIADYEVIEKPEETKAHAEKILREGRADFETKHRTKQGEIRDVLVTVQVIELAGRRVFHSIFRDITELKRAEQRIDILREIDQAITSTLNLFSVLSVLLDKIDLLLPYPAATIRLFDKESGLLEPVACRNLDEKEWKAEQWRVGRGIPNAVFETKCPIIISDVQNDPRIRDRDFFVRHRLVSYLGVPLIAKDEILGVLSFYTREYHEFAKDEVDFLVTLANQAAIAIHNAQLYEKTKRQAVELETSNRVKDEFLSVMSHEMRTPLNVVMGYAAMMKDGMLGDLNPKQDDALGKILGRANDQLAMISNILFATAIDTAKIPAERQVVILADLFNDLESAYHAQATGRNLTLNWDCPPDLPLLETDRAKLKQILQNLIDNAIKFTEKGSVTISARVIEGTGQQALGNRQQEEETLASRLMPHAFVEFKVADTGVGIPQDMLAVIFEKFRQVDSSETRIYGGVGMGLYIVKRFTEMLGGTVEVESEPGKGSTFTVRIPS